MVANPRTEPVAIIVNLLTNNWIPANTSNSTPTIVDDVSGRKEYRQPGGFVAVYQEGPYRRTRDDTHGDFRTHKLPLTLQCHAQTRPKLLAILGEIERILANARFNPDPYWDWIEDLGEAPVGQFPNNVWTTISIELWANSIATAS